MLLGLITALVALVPTAALASKHKRAPIHASQAFSLPSARRCVSGRTLSFRVLKLHGVTWVGVTVKIDGRRFKTIGRARLSRALKLTGLPEGRFVLSVTLKARDGRSVTLKRTYGTCAPKPTTSIAPGSYKGLDSQGYGVGFYVSGNGQQIQDVTVSDVGMSCSNGGGMSDLSFSIAQTPITNGAFTAATTQTTSTETITYTFRGAFESTGVAGQLSETIALNSGTPYTCTSHTLSWSATRTAQGSQAATAPAPGSYKGLDSEGYGVGFYVSGNGQQIQDVTVSDVGMSCSNGGGMSDLSFSIAQTPITNGAFTAATTQTTSTETITYTFTGHFHGLDTSGNTRVAGQLSETIALNSGTPYTCTSHTLSWSATRTAQGSQAATAPAPGSYKGVDSEGYGVGFYVSGNGQQIQDVTVSDVGMSCSNGGGMSDLSFSIAQTPITNGAFTAATTQTTSTETITYTFTGHFHGLDTSGNTRVAGQLSETIALNSGTPYTCTSHTLSWSGLS